MPDNDLQAHMADGTILHFPVGTSPDVVQSTVKRHVAMSQPIRTDVSPTFDPSKTQPSPRAIPATAQQPATVPNTSGFFGTLGSDVKSAIAPFNPFDKSPPHQLSDPTEAERVALTQRQSAGQSSARAIPEGIAETAFGGNMQGFDQALKSDNYSQALAHLLVPVAQAATMFKAGTEAPERIAAIPEALRGGAREVLGEGASKYALKADLHEHAMRTQQHVAQVADSVHSEAQQAMSAVAEKIDAAHPEGVFEKAPLRAKVQEAMGDIVKIPEKMPASIAKMLKDESTEGKSTGPRIGGRFMDLSKPDDLTMYQQLKKQGAFAPEEVKRIEGESEKPNWTFEQLKQFRSDLGRELSGFDKRGAPGAAANKVYGMLSEELRKQAENDSVGSDWLNATGKYKQYADDFMRSPVRKILKGQNASQIMNPLTGDNAVPVQQILSKYGAHGIDMNALMDETRRFSGAQTVQRFSRPGRLDLIMAGISPKIAALRVFLPRRMRSPGALDTVFGKGFEDMPSIPTKKVALKAAQRNP
jgi:hypothetical protein